MLSRKFPTSSENTAELVGQVKFSNLLIVHLQRTAGSEKLQRRSKLYPKGQLWAVHVTLQSTLSAQSCSSELRLDIRGAPEADWEF